MTDRPDLDTIEARDQRDAAEAGTIVSTMGALGAVRFSAAHADRYRLLTYARALEQERDAAQAQHDAEIAGIVAMLRESPGVARVAIDLHDDCGIFVGGPAGSHIGTYEDTSLGRAAARAWLAVGVPRV